MGRYHTKGEYWKSFPITIPDPVLKDDLEVECWFYFYKATAFDAAYVDLIDVRWEGTSICNDFNAAQWKNIESLLLAECLNNSHK
jgi:hypothetical protein